MIHNVTAYLFISLSAENLPLLQAKIKACAKNNRLKGTIFLSQEGIKFSVAGQQNEITAFQAHLADYPSFQALKYHTSYSHTAPFKKLVVKIKKELITFKQQQIQPDQSQGVYVTPEMLKQWYDEKKDMVLLDTRNTFEFHQGSFAKAIHLNLHHFSEFPKAITTLPDEYKKKVVVTFCTGGIRCEKASLYLMEQGYENVYQLEGGILHYMEKFQGEHFSGNCFVFDDRIALTPQLEPL